MDAVDSHVPARLVADDRFPYLTYKVSREGCVNKRKAEAIEGRGGVTGR